jgi:hypothetical protein
MSPEEFTLPIHEKAKILRNNIFGVDIDPQAVEITMMSLYLKALEGERGLLPKKQHLLPPLSNNIKCGNSLIGYDIFDSRFSPAFGNARSCHHGIITPPSPPLKEKINAPKPPLKLRGGEGGVMSPRKEGTVSRSDSIPLNHSVSPLAKGGIRGVVSLDEETKSRINPFDWNSKSAGFGEIINPSQSPLEKGGSKGGFDVVIGNPPYVRQEMLGEFKDYFQKHYEVYHGVADLYAYFIERGVSLLKNGGLFSYIVANKWMRANYGEPLRRWMKTQRIEEIIDFGDLPVFETATTYPCIIRIRKEARTIPPLAKGGKGGFSFPVTKVSTLNFENLDAYVKGNSFPVVRASLDDKGWSLVDEKSQALLTKLRNIGIPLGEYVKNKIFFGIKTGLNEAFVVDETTKDKLIKEYPQSSYLLRPFLVGKDIKRYEPPKSNKYLIFIPKGWSRKKAKEMAISKPSTPPLEKGGKGGIDLVAGITKKLSARAAWDWLKETYPPITEHLKPYADAAEKRYDKGEYWWELRACDYYDEFEKPKIILPDISVQGNFAFDETGSYFSSNTTYIISSSDKFLLGVLNSTLMTFYYKNSFATYRGGYLRFFIQYISSVR